jgi:hypothetical protein
MRSVIIIIIVFTWTGSIAQLRMNVAVTSPPFFESVDIGRSQRYSSVKSALSAGLEFDNIRPRGDDIGKLHYCMGFYYSNPAYIGVFTDENDNRFISQISTRVINMPLLVRGSLRISDLIENNYLGMELGIITTTWMKYKLEEVASIKVKDISGNTISETLYSDKGSLINGFGSKFNFKISWGMFAYVNRFYLGFRLDILSLSNMYSDRLSNKWNLPDEYSLYDHASKQGRMKNPCGNLVVAYRITKK